MLVDFHEKKTRSGRLSTSLSEENVGFSRYCELEVVFFRLITIKLIFFEKLCKGLLIVSGF